MRRWDFRLVPSERSLEAVGKSVRLHIIGRSKAFDLFPRTHKGKNRCVLRKKHALINSREPLLKSDINLEQSSHVETVCLLSKLSEVKNHISVKVDMNEMDLTAAESKATYQEIKEWVKEKYGFHVSHLNIAKTKRKCGIIERKNYNLPKNEDSRSPETPKEKEEAITEAFRHFQMI